jgi:hypothetical protein
MLWKRLVRYILGAWESIIVSAMEAGKLSK